MMSRRAFLAGAAAAAAASAFTGNSAPPAPASRDEFVAEFLRYFSRLSEGRKEVALDLLRALVDLPKGADSEPLFAEARRRMAAID